MIAVLVAVAAGVGAVCRHEADRLVVAHLRTELPVGTFLVNVSGSVLLGLVVGLGTHHGLANHAVTVIGAGFAGGYTTLSTWAWATVVLARERETRAAILNVAGSIAIGLLAAAAGLGLARL